MHVLPILALLCGSVSQDLWPASEGPRSPSRSALQRVLVFSKTAGYRHDSIPSAIQLIRELGKEDGYAVDATEDATTFTKRDLGRYQVVAFALTTGDVLDTTQESALREFIESGGGYVGIHAAADTEYDWPWYGDLVGAWFLSHPAIQEATVHVEDRRHPITSFLPATLVRKDEWYDYRTNPRSKAHVLMSLDTNTYRDAKMTGDHPITWCHSVGKGRSFYTGFGHTKETYAEPMFREMLRRAIQWVAKGSAGSGERLHP
jgi:type 1 glutamine amidotransferase